MADIAFVPEGDILHCCNREAAQNTGEAADALAQFRIALVWHGGRTLLTFRERLEGLAEFGALKVTNLLRHFLKRTAQQCQRGNKVSVAVALHDLAGDRLDPQPHPLTD